MRRHASPLSGLVLLLPLLAGCGDGAPDPEAAAEDEVIVVKPVAVDWSRCRFPGLSLPVPGRLFVVDGGAPAPDAEPGRESIRRVDIVVPGQVVLFLTAPDPTVWLVRPSPETEVLAVFASGDQPQRITGQSLGRSQLARSAAMGDACGRYWLQEGAGPALDEASAQVFGRGHDAIYRMRGGQAIIGGPDDLPETRPGQ